MIKGFFFFLYRVISFISVVLRETTLTISASTGDPISMESETVRMVSLSVMEISEITRLKIRWSGCDTLTQEEIYSIFSLVF